MDRAGGDGDVGGTSDHGGVDEFEELLRIVDLEVDFCAALFEGGDVGALVVAEAAAVFGAAAGGKDRERSFDDGGNGLSSSDDGDVAEEQTAAGAGDVTDSDVAC